MDDSKHEPPVAGDKKFMLSLKDVALGESFAENLGENELIRGFDFEDAGTATVA